MCVTKVVVNAAEVKRLLNGEGQYSGVERDLLARAQNVLESAQASALVDSGDYRDHLHIETMQTNEGLKVQIGGASSHDYEVEALTGNLARSIDAARSA